MKAFATTVVALAAFAWPLAAHAADRSVNERKAADPQGTVEVVNVAGSVDVSGWDRNEVEVTGTLGDKVERLDFNVSGNRTTIRVVLPSGMRSWGTGDGSADLIIRVPQKSGVQTSLVSADVKVRGVGGEQQLTTVSGNIDTELAGESRLRAVSGDVTVNGRESVKSLDLTTVSGDVMVRGGIGGSVSVTAVSGDLRIELGTLASGKFKTVSGDLTLSAGLTPDARLDLESVSGDLRVQFNGSAPPPAEYNIESFSGSIHNCFGPKPIEERFGPGTRLDYREGAGTARVRADTHSGDVSLCTKK